MKCFIAFAALTVLQVCLTGVEAVATNAACSASSTCTEATDYCDATTNQCRRKVDEACTTSTADCITNAACSTTCSCSTNYVANDAKTKCLLVVGRTCTADAECLENGECAGSSTKACACKSGFSENTTTKKCTANGANGLGVSISMLILVFLTTRLF